LLVRPNLAQHFQAGHFRQFQIEQRQAGKSETSRPA
jgi:hypothetical protein